MHAYVERSLGRSKSRKKYGEEEQHEEERGGEHPTRPSAIPLPSSTYMFVAQATKCVIYDSRRFVSVFPPQHDTVYNAARVIRGDTTTLPHCIVITSSAVYVENMTRIPTTKRGHRQIVSKT